LVADEPIMKRPDRMVTRRLKRGAVNGKPPASREPESRSSAPPLTSASRTRGNDTPTVDLQRRRDHLNARVAELQFDLGGLVYEMAIRDRIRVDVIVQRAAALQAADAELGEVERILRLEQTSTAGQCPTCAAPHSSGAAYCWQCGQPILQEIASDAIIAPQP
jgi:hypothetical protein